VETGVDDALVVTDNYDALDPMTYRDIFIKPEKFQDAWDHECPWQQEKWRDAIKKELDKMEKLKVWKVMKRCDKPPERRCVGIFKARLVACGYSQVPGVDFTEAYSPVMHDVSFQILIIAEILWKLDSQIMDVETAFLNGDLEEEIYMRIGFTQSNVEPCLFVRNDADGIVLMAIHVDDCYMVGTKKGLKSAVEQITKSGLTVKVEHTTKDFLSCEIVFNKEKTRAWLGQPHLMKKLEASFGHLVKGCL